MSELPRPSLFPLPGVPPSAEVLIAPPKPVVRVSAVRTTLIHSSLESLRARSLFERYATALPDEHHEQLLGTLTPGWVPLEAARAHYEACDALGLSAEQQHSMGLDVGARIKGTFLGAVVRTSRALGVTPWTLLGQLDRLWPRLFVGGGVGLYRVAHKDARVELHGLSLLDVDYFRHAICGVIQGLSSLFSPGAVVAPMTEQAQLARLAMRVYWGDSQSPRASIPP